MTVITTVDDVHRDTHVFGDNYYLTNGQGCGTIWFGSLAEARRFRDLFGNHADGYHSGICERCACHYSISDPEHGKYPEWACYAWKEEMKESARRLKRTKLGKLMREAIASFEFRGHEMKPWRVDFEKCRALTECKVCGMMAGVIMKPSPTEINIGGRAVAISCSRIERARGVEVEGSNV